MPLRTVLTPTEIGQILECRSQGFRYKRIARQIRRSPAVVWNYLKNPDSYGRKKRPGRRKKLSSREKRDILRSASSSDMSVAQIRSEYQLQVSKPKTWRMVKASPQIVRSRMKKAPKLTDSHKANRVEFARMKYKP